MAGFASVDVAVCEDTVTKRVGWQGPSHCARCGAGIPPNVWLHDDDIESRKKSPHESETAWVCSTVATDESKSRDRFPRQGQQVRYQRRDKLQVFPRIQ